MAVCQPAYSLLTHRYREQAPSHILTWLACYSRFRAELLSALERFKELVPTPTIFLLGWYTDP